MITNRFTQLGTTLVFMAILVSVQAADKPFKWTDDKGVVHYGDNPPDRSTAVQMNVHTGRASEPGNEQSSNETPQVANQETKNNEKTTSQPAANENAKIVKENCDIYKQNLSALKNSSRIREKDANGEYRYLTSEEKAQREKDADTYLKEHCQ